MIFGRYRSTHIDSLAVDRITWIVGHYPSHRETHDFVVDFGLDGVPDALAMIDMELVSCMIGLTDKHPPQD